MPSGPRYAESYHYDKTGQILSAQSGESSERFIYDPAANLLNETGELAKANRLTRYGGYAYEYDAFGRLIKRTHIVEGTEQHFEYDSEHRMTTANAQTILERIKAVYRYDALGRRIEKTVERQKKHSQEKTTESTTFFWQGMRLSGEVNSKQPEKQTLYIYNEFSYEPIARVVSDNETNSQTVHYYHTLLNSLPTELTDEEGDIVWRADYTLFGKLKRQQKRYDDIGEQNLRFAGQYFDKDKFVGNKFEQRASVGPLGRVSG